MIVGRRRFQCIGEAADVVKAPPPADVEHTSFAANVVLSLT